MKLNISNRVRRNITFTLLIIGTACTLVQGWNVAMMPSSGKAWFDLFAIAVASGFCLNRFLELRKLVKQNVLAGSR